MKIKFNEIGRSMVEMLGVLAIIGVLSVAGVGTYQYALTAYQVGKVQDVLGKAKTLAQTDSRASHALEVNRFLKSALPEYTPDDKKSMVKLVDGNYQVTTFKVVYKVCEKLLQRESILNDMGISVLTRTCGNTNSKTSVVFSFNATPTFESGSHFGGGSSDGTGMDNPHIEPQSCLDKMVWRQKDDGTYGCVCRHEYEFGDNCERCYPPKIWRADIEACTCDEPNGFWEDAGTCVNNCLSSEETTTTQEYSFEFITEHFLWVWPRVEEHNLIIDWIDTWDGVNAPQGGKSPIPLRTPLEGSRHNYGNTTGSKGIKCDKYVMSDLWSGSADRHFGISIPFEDVLESQDTFELKEIMINQISGTGCVTNTNILAPANQYTLLTYCPVDGSHKGIVQLKATAEYTVYSCPLEGFTCDSDHKCIKQ
ncbi:MAG: hypothetical protein IKZ02_06075 [Alphaproteobacteria bacterium]|nr:hypothetical protein [Alphaproteobacteria bacterium]